MIMKIHLVMVMMMMMMVVMMMMIINIIIVAVVDMMVMNKSNPSTWRCFLDNSDLNNNAFSTLFFIL